MKSSLNRIQPLWYVENQLANMKSKCLIFLFSLALLAPSWVRPSPVPDDDVRDRQDGDEHDDSPSDSDDMDREGSDQNDQSDNYINRSNEDRDDYNTKSNEDNDDHSNRRFDDNDDYNRRKKEDDDYTDRRNDDHRVNDWGEERRNKGKYGDDYGNRMEDNGESFHIDDEDKWKTKKRGNREEEGRSNDEDDYDRAHNSVEGSQSRIASGSMSIFNANSVCIFVGVVICHVQFAISLL